MFSLDIATTPAGRRLEVWLVGLVLAACLVGPRVMHLGPEIDGPHGFVQIDREFSVWAYYRHGLTLFDMHVCYFGGHRTNLLEFPLPDLVPAALYRVFGPHVLLARLSTLSFFLGAALFLYLFVKYLFDRRLAVITLAVYLVLPMSIYFSRAVLMHDFFAIFMAHAMVYLYLRGFDEGRNGLVALGCACATLGLLVKAPYVFYFFLPLGVYFLRARRPSRLLKLTPLFVLPVIPFLAWRSYVDGVNAMQPDWYFLKTYLRFVDMGHWYYGPLAMRFEWKNWHTLLHRFAYDIATPVGTVLFPLGVWFLRKEKNAVFVVLWAVGALAATVVFFRLNVVHSYYQNPFVALAAVGIAACLWRALPRDTPVTRPALAAVAAVFLAFAVGCVVDAERDYYQVGRAGAQIGRAIAELTDEDALVVVVAPTIVSAQDPTLLGLAHRYGWPVPRRVVTPEVLGRLRAEGATAVAWLELMGDPPPSDVLDQLAGAPVVVREIGGGPAKLYVFDLEEMGHRWHG